MKNKTPNRWTISDIVRKAKYFAEHFTIEMLLNLIASNRRRLKKLIELNAPESIIKSERNILNMRELALEIRRRNNAINRKK